MSQHGFLAAVAKSAPKPRAKMVVARVVSFMLSAGSEEFGLRSCVEEFEVRKMVE